MFRAGVIHNKARFKIIEAIQNEIDIRDEVFNICGIDIVDFDFDLDGRIHEPQLRFCSDRFGKIVSDIFFIKEGLAL